MKLVQAFGRSLLRWTLLKSLASQLTAFGPRLTKKLGKILSTPGAFPHSTADNASFTSSSVNCAEKIDAAVDAAVGSF